MPLRRPHANRIGLLVAAAIFVVIGVGVVLGAQRFIGDANRVRKWLEAHPEVTSHPEAQVAKVTSSAT